MKSFIKSLIVATIFFGANFVESKLEAKGRYRILNQGNSARAFGNGSTVAEVTIVPKGSAGLFEAWQLSHDGQDLASLSTVTIKNVGNQAWTFVADANPDAQVGTRPSEPTEWALERTKDDKHFIKVRGYGRPLVWTVLDLGPDDKIIVLEPPSESENQKFVFETINPDQ